MRKGGRKGNGGLLENEEGRTGRRKQGKEMEGCWGSQSKGGVDDAPCVACMVAASGAPSSSHLTYVRTRSRCSPPS